MSYSFQVRAPSVSEAMAAVTAKFDAEVVGPQPIHQRDRDAVLKNVEATLSLLGEKPTVGPHEWQVAVQVNGYVSWYYTRDTATPDVATVPLTNVSISATASWTQIIPPDHN